MSINGSESELLQQILAATRESLLANFAYDVVKVVFGFLLGRVLIDKLYMTWRWGGWNVIVWGKEDDKKKELTKRKLSPSVAKRILEDETEYSVYVKGVISPYIRLNIDPCSPSAAEIGLIRKDLKRKHIVIDIDKNPPTGE